MAPRPPHEPPSQTPRMSTPPVDAPPSSNGQHAGMDFPELEARFAAILTEPDPAAWFATHSILMLATFYGHPQYWGLAKATYKKWGGNAFDLEQSVKRFLAHHPEVEDGYAADETFDPFIFTDATTIQARPHVPRRWLVPGLIADGLTILGGSPKSGKSYLAYALALAVTSYGRWCNHWPVDKGTVVFVALEDDVDETQNRLAELDPALRLEAGQLYFVHGMDAIPKFDAGALGWIEATLIHHQPRLLIIDPLSYLYVMKRSGNQFEETKDMLLPLRWLGKKHKCAIVCIDHRRKRSREDISVFDTLHGSVAKQAVADSLLMVDRQEKDITLAGLIRNANDQLIHLTMEFQNGQVFLAYKSGGSNTPATYTDLRMKVFQTLQSYAVALSIKEILALAELPDLGSTRSNVTQILVRAAHHGDIGKTEREKYVWIQKD